MFSVNHSTVYFEIININSRESHVEILNLHFKRKAGVYKRKLLCRKLCQLVICIERGPIMSSNNRQVDTFAFPFIDFVVAVSIETLTFKVLLTRGLVDLGGFAL